MQLNYNNKYKEREPLETIKIISDFFINQNYRININKYQTKVGTYWCRLLLQDGDTVILEANGKGVTEEYSLASGYAELYERFCAKIFVVTNPFLMAQYFNIHKPDIFFNHIDDILKDDKTINDFYSWFFKDKQDFTTFISLMYGYNNLIPGEYFYNLQNIQDKKLVNYGLLTQLTGSNGLAAGNTLEEALVQGISEWCERYVMNDLVLKAVNNSSINIPCIKIEILPINLQQIINNIISLENCDIYILDFSYMYNLPVCAALLVNKIKLQYYYSFGAAPCFNICVERCLTELYQGISDEFHKTLNTEHLQIPFKAINLKKDPVMVRTITSLLSRNFCPFETLNFDIKDTINNQVFLNDKNYTNQNLIEFYKNLLQKLQIDIYYKNLSNIKDIYVVKVYSPTLNSLTSNLLIHENNLDFKITNFNYFLNIYSLFFKALNNNNNFLELYYLLTQLKNIDVTKSSNIYYLKTLIFTDLGEPITLPAHENLIEKYKMYQMIYFLKKPNLNLLTDLGHDEIIYYYIYNLLKNDYSIEEIQQILQHFDIYFSNDEILNCSLNEYITFKIFLNNLNTVYNNDITTHYLLTLP